jgi:hypothetical protein
VFTSLSGPDWRVNLNRYDDLNFVAKCHRIDHTVQHMNIAFYGLIPWVVKVQTAVIFLAKFYLMQMPSFLIH